MIKSIKIFIYALLFLYSTGVLAQEQIKGFVKNDKENPIEGASVVLYDYNNDIITYNYTNANGEFAIFFKNKTDLKLVVKSLGYEQYSKVIKFTSESEKKNFTFRITLLEKAFELNEIVLKSDEKISSNNNITTVKVNAFSDGTEQTVEDVLKDLPGIEVLKNGSIKAHGKFIDKLLIEDDDIFDSNYKVLSKNLDAKVLESVQIIDEFEDNPILAQVINSEKVALNLVLKKRYKNIWFGNLNIGVGHKDRFNLSSNIGLIRKKIKFFNFNNYNNLGEKASNQVNDSPVSINYNSTYQEEKIERSILPIFTIKDNVSTVFDEGQSIFNKGFINSLGFVISINPKIKLRGSSFFVKDVQDELFSLETIFNINENPIRYFENNNILRKNLISGGNVELKYSINKNSYLKNTIVYKNKPSVINNQLFFNDTNIVQNLKKSESAFYNHLNYTLLLGGKKILNNYVYFGENKIAQNNTIISPTLNSFLSINENSQVNNDSNDKLIVLGGKSSLITSIGKSKTLFELNYESQETTNNNKFTYNEDNSNEVDSLQNRLNFNQQTLELNASSRYPISKNIELSTELSLDYLDINTEKSKISKWFINHRISINIKKAKMGFFKLSYNTDYVIPKSYLFLNNFQLNNYQSFKRGGDSIYIPKQKKLSFFYIWSNYLKTKSFTLRARYSVSDSKYASDIEIGENIILTSYSFANGDKKLSLNTNYTSYFKKLNLSINLGASKIWSAIPIKANTLEFQDLQTTMSNYFLSGTTYFKLPINFRFKVDMSYNKSKFNTVTSRFLVKNADLDITHKLSKFWIASVNNNFYWIVGLDYHFITLNLNHTPEKSKFSYQLVLNNLTNENNFSTVNIDEYSTYKSNLRLLPRYLLLSVKYRF